MSDENYNYRENFYKEDETLAFKPPFINYDIATECYSMVEQHSTLSELQLFNSPAEQCLENEELDELIRQIEREKLCDSDTQKVEKVIEQILLQDIYSNLNVNHPKPPVNNVHFFDRNRDCRFTIDFNIPEYFAENVKLKIEIVPSIDDQPVRALSCDKPNHNSTAIFSCNGVLSNRHVIDNLWLNKDARELICAIKFHCNSTCSTMWKKSQLVFSFYDGMNRFIRSFKMFIKISERANRDERTCRERLSSGTYDETVMSSPESTEFVQDFNERKKDYPKFDIFNYNNIPFDVFFGQNKMAQDNVFYATVKDKVNFVISVPSTPQNLKIKITCADKEDPSKIFKRCEKHAETSVYCQNEKFHVIKCDSSETKYVGNPDDAYQSDRLSLEIPVREETFTVALSFMCLNTCFHKNKKAYISLIFTLEDETGFVYGRRVFFYKILHRPNRCHFGSNSPTTQKRRCSTSSSDEGYSSASPFINLAQWDYNNVYSTANLEGPPNKYFIR